MPELPEITARAQEMKQTLTGKTIGRVRVLQSKCLNIAEDDFIRSLLEATIRDVSNRGKWLFVDISKGWLLLNMGMGGEILLVTSKTLPKKYRLAIEFTDGDILTINFWWFGYAHYVPQGELENHPMTAKLGPNALEITAEDFKSMFQGSKQRLKSMLLDQSRLAGIGNAYIHDILFLAGLHPLRRVDGITGAEIRKLVAGIRAGLQPSIDMGGAFYEVDLFGKAGGFTQDKILIGYREGQPCPNCQTKIIKIKTGGTSSFICPSCQKAE